MARYRSLFIGTDTDLSYLDGNSLGRPLKRTQRDISTFIEEGWGGRLIRGWDEEWLDLPQTIGDQLGRAVLGAAPGQTVIADSTTVVLYKLIRAALATVADTARTEIVLDTDNFPTDRYLVEGIALEEGLTLRWIEADPTSGVTVEQVRDATGPATAVVLLSHVAYRSGFLADLPASRKLHTVRGGGGLGPVPLRWIRGAGPGRGKRGFCRGLHLQVPQRGTRLAGVRIRQWQAPARSETADLGLDGTQGRVRDGRRLRAGARDPEFPQRHPAIFGMLAMRGTLDLIEEAGMAAIREKSLKLTAYAVQLVEAWLEPAGVQLASPREPELRGSHITLDHPAFRNVTAALWEQDVIPDFRAPHGIRVGCRP
ncbi:kynureninase [Arthrobacter sp. Hiyo4]|nr:kynureninase [Arthrobacter sp. Hiyo4]